MAERKLDHAAEFAKAVREFNSWRFYDAHETLEDVWRECGGKARGKAAADRDPLADFYQGVIKTAAGFHHLLRGNYGGTLKVLGDVPRLLEPYRPATLGVDVDRLLADVERALAAVRELGPGRIGEFDRALVPRLVIGES
jgi:predicted metal-dependent hydrolase